MIETSLRQIAEAAAEASQHPYYEHDFSAHTANTLQSIEDSLVEEAIFSPEAWDLFFTELHEAATSGGDGDQDAEPLAEPPAALEIGTDYRQTELSPLFITNSTEEAA